jgi:Zn-dependent protease with chaperone function
MALYLSLLGVFVVAMGAIGLVVRALPERTCERLSGRSSAVLLLMPILVAAGLTASLIAPSLISGGCHCLAHGLHHLHFCATHPEYAHAALLPASLSLLVWSALALPRLRQLSTDVVRTWIWSRKIAREKLRTFDGVPFRLVDAPELGACTTGLLHPMIALDRRMWRKLDGEQRRAVLHHENAHRERLDPLTLTALRACAAICLIPNRTPFLRRWQAQAELECDRHAATQIDDPDPVAEALLKLERLRAGGLPRISAAAIGGNLAERVRALLDPRWVAARANLHNDFVRALTVALILTAVWVVPLRDELHHAAETVLGHLVHH